MKTKPSVFIVVPFLNEEENLPELYSRLNTVFSGRAETAEFLFVDDGPTGGSFQCLEKRLFVKFSGECREAGTIFDGMTGFSGCLSMRGHMIREISILLQ